MQKCKSAFLSGNPSIAVIATPTIPWDEQMKKEKNPKILNNLYLVLSNDMVSTILPNSRNQYLRIFSLSTIVDHCRIIVGFRFADERGHSCTDSQIEVIIGNTVLMFSFCSLNGKIVHRTFLV